MFDNFWRLIGQNTVVQPDWCDRYLGSSSWCKSIIGWLHSQVNEQCSLYLETGRPDAIEIVILIGITISILIIANIYLPDHPLALPPQMPPRQPLRAFQQAYVPLVDDYGAELQQQPANQQMPWHQELAGARAGVEIAELAAEHGNENGAENGPVNANEREEEPVQAVMEEGQPRIGEGAGSVVKEDGNLDM